MSMRLQGVWKEWAQERGECRLDERGDAWTVTYWTICGRCGGKISRLNHNEQAQGYHNRCMTEEAVWQPHVRLYAHDGQLEMKLVGKD